MFKKKPSLGEDQVCLTTSFISVDNICINLQTN